jgi:hypothetical protein
MSEQGNQQTNKKDSSNPGFWRILQSTLAGAIGVQSNKNREKDFENGNIWVFIASGIIFTLLFILTITTVVRLAISAN